MNRVLPAGTAGRLVVPAAAVTWLGVAGGRRFGWAAVVVGFVCLAVAVIARRGRVAAAVIAAALLSGTLSVGREAAALTAVVPEGPVRVAGRVLDDPRPALHGYRVAIRPSHLYAAGTWEAWDGPVVLVDSGTAPPVTAGDRVDVEGALRPGGGRLGGVVFAGRLRASTVLRLDGPSDPLFRVANALRRRVMSGLEPFRPDPAAALTAGFLIGDTTGLPAGDDDGLRRAGLSHYVAVSGSNVALFLAAWFVVAGPLGWSPRRRAVVGLVGLAVFAVVTRWEASVVRASVMAGLMLAGRAVGIPLDAWTALGSAVILLLLVSGDLVGDVGFQLSVAATAGVIWAAGLVGARRGKVVQVLAATAGAQLAVAPLLLVHFGTVPLLAPLTNLVAAPLVTFSTAAAGVGVVGGVGAVTAVGVRTAGVVLLIARAAAGLPQLGPVPVAGLGVAAAAATRRRLRPVVAFGTAVFALASVVPAPPPEVPTVTFLDVGQGDGAVLLGPAGETVLIDGGLDPGRLLGSLRNRGVDHVDLMVVSHRDADHAAGLVGVVAAGMPVGRVWHPGHRDTAGAYGELLEAAARAGIPVEVPAAGWTADVGSFHLEVLGPLRRYADTNNQGIVALVEAGGASVLFTGDIEALAQDELGTVHADVLKVPHHGSKTSDPAWLAAIGAELAVVSVGPNTFGHPDAGIIEVLETAGTQVVRTDEVGDVELELGPARVLVTSPP